MNGHELDMNSHEAELDENLRKKVSDLGAVRRLRPGEVSAESQYCSVLLQSRLAAETRGWGGLWYYLRPVLNPTLEVAVPKIQFQNPRDAALVNANALAHQRKSYRHILALGFAGLIQAIVHLADSNKGLTP